jgi:hypothetical protein
MSLGACDSGRNDSKSRASQLVGNWSLLLRHDCEQYPIQSDELILRSGGVFEQHTTMKDGQKVDSIGQHWEYSAKDHVVLNKRRDWEIHSDPSLSNGKDPKASLPPAGEAEFEALIVQFGSPSVILINPDSDCMYVKTK